MSNRTLLDELSDFPSTSSEGFGSGEDENDRFPVPVDPFVDVQNITEGREGTFWEDFDSENGTSILPEWRVVKEFLEINEWLIYAALAFVIFIIVTVITIIVCWIYKHKKTLINSQSDPILNSTYDQGFSFRCCCCCRTAEKEQKIENRQNSASNLEAYGRREPLPDTAYRNPQDVMKATSTPKSTTSPKMLNETIDDRSLGVYINAIKDVPSRVIPQSEFRELPPLRLPRTNVYQSYQS
ncbi:unnamed protein product [Caenorhabditis angaria]|uniref:Uncharacterized protein n=1 Tax=Caenorhabditis angaria TaxID=860376 RepID=A0A9P1ISQ5_9PELO|nr:unnamed protein product [Caenorhabditis angaria]